MKGDIIMTGKDLIMFILVNDLEDVEIVDEVLMSSLFMTVAEAAENFGVGIATVDAWINMDRLPSVMVKGTTYIPRNAKNPKEIVSK